MDTAVVQLNAASFIAQKTYHSEDNIAELCVRIRLRPCQVQGIAGQSELGESADRMAPTTSGMAPTTSGEALLGGQGAAQAPTMVAEETEEFRWSQRVLGFHEPPGPSEIRQGSRLFSRYFKAGTKPDEDDGGVSPLPEAHEESAGRRRSCKSLPCCPSLRCCHRNRKSVAARAVSENMRVENLAFYDRMQFFFVIDVAPKSEDSASESKTTRYEVLLCDLRAQESGRVLVVQPPFSKTVAGEQLATGDHVFAYHFELPDGKSYEYSIENASYAPTEDERRRAIEAQHGFESAAPQLRRNLAGTGFEGLGHSSMQMAVLGEIIAFEPYARGTATTTRLHRDVKHESDGGTAWEAEAIMRRTTPIPFHAILWRPSFYVVYELSLPGTGEWEIFGGSLAKDMRMSTQFTSLSGCATEKERCVFNHPLEVHLSYNPQSQATLDGPAPDHLPPRIVLQVLQIGSWDRHNLLGYTFVDIPQLPGEYDVRVPLWSPVGTLSQQLTAKLCGAFMPLASPHLVANADMHRRDALPRNRSALRAQTAAGMLHLRLNVVRRHRKSTLAQAISNVVPGAKLAIEGNTAMPDPGGQLEGLRRRRAARAQRKAEAAQAQAQAQASASALLANVQHQPLVW